MSMIFRAVLSHFPPAKVHNSRFPSMKFPTSRFPLASSHPASRCKILFHPASRQVKTPHPASRQTFVGPSYFSWAKHACLTSKMTSRHTAYHLHDMYISRRFCIIHLLCSSRSQNVSSVISLLEYFLQKPAKRQRKKKWPVAVITHSLQSPSREIHILRPPDKFENATLSLRIRLPSTLIRIKRSTKTEPFENALQSGTI